MPKISKSVPPAQPAVGTKPVAKKKQTADVDPWDRIAPIGFNDNDGLKMLLYGSSGTGKTRTWSTFPGPILAMMCSSVKNPGEARSIDTPENRKKIFQVPVYKAEEVLALAHKQAETARFATVVLDHASGLQDLAMKEILGIDEMPAQLSWGVATREQWGLGGANCREIIRALLNLNCHVVIVAQQRDFSDKSEGGDVYSDLSFPTISAGLTPSLAGWLAPACDYVCQTFKRPVLKETKLDVGGEEVSTWERTGKTEFCARTGPHDIVTTKFRVPVGIELPDAIVNPTFDKLYNLIKGIKVTKGSK